MFWSFVYLFWILFSAPLHWMPIEWKFHFTWPNFWSISNIFFFCYTPHPPDSIKKAQRECSRDEFTCSDRTCIPLYRKCDQNPDCPDASDESLRECYQSEYPIRHLYLTTTRSEVRQSRFLCHAMPYCAQHKTLIRKNINVFDSTSARLDMA